MLPAHGGAIDDPAAVLNQYLEHRHRREDQIVAALRAGDRRPEAIVDRIYERLAPGLKRLAHESVVAHLVKLRDEGRARSDGEDVGAELRPDGRQKQPRPLLWLRASGCRLQAGSLPTPPDLVPSEEHMVSFLERRFHLAEHGTTPRTEVLAGVTTFLTLAYILFVQPALLSSVGLDFGAVFVATCLASAFATLLMAGLANYPIAVAPAMGHNFYFTFTVVVAMGGPVGGGAGRGGRRRAPVHRNGRVRSA